MWVCVCHARRTEVWVIRALLKYEVEAGPDWIPSQFGSGRGPDFEKRCATGTSAIYTWKVTSLTHYKLMNRFACVFILICSLIFLDGCQGFLGWVESVIALLKRCAFHHLANRRVSSKTDLEPHTLSMLPKYLQTYFGILCFSTVKQCTYSTFNKGTLNIFQGVHIILSNPCECLI